LSTLTVYWPDGKEQVIELGPNPVSIGRNPENDVSVPTEWTSISGAHCKITLEDGSYILTDTSTNGTFIEDERVTGKWGLEDNQTIRIGNKTLGQDVYLTFKQQSGGMFTEPMQAIRSQQEAAAAAVSPRPPAAASPPASKPGPTMGIAYLTVRWPSGEDVTFYINSDHIRVGRSPDNDLVVPPTIGFVSGQHFEIRSDGQNYTLDDLNSTNGTRINNHLVTPGSPIRISDSDIIRIGSEQFGSSIGFTFKDPSQEQAPQVGFTSIMDSRSLLQIQEISIGRDPGNDIVLPSPQVAAKHALVRLVTGQIARLEVLDDRIGASVNDTPVQNVELKPGDVIQIGPHIFTFDGAKLNRFDSQGYRMDVVDVFKEVRTSGGKLRILDDISMSILPREFVALVGGSGAGKSTLLDALNGFRPASGTILLNGRDFYKDLDAFRTQLGYVPQYDILHNILKVDDALDYSARLRLPGDVSRKERQKRITEVLEVVGLNIPSVRQTKIINLSGGQRKRVSIAAELLADPKVFFLDEPTSGLDPGLEKKMMYTLRKMADEGRTIILITHATGNIVQVDHVAFLAQGRLIYFGPPQECGGYFDVTDFADIYEKIERHGEEWRRVFTQEKPDLFQRYIIRRQQNRPQGGKKKLRAPRFGLGQAIRQFIVYTQRTLKITFNEPISLVILLGVMPLIAFFLLLSTNVNTLVGDPGIVSNPALAAERLMENYVPVKDAQTTLFTMSLAAVLVGLFGASNELIKERSVYLRERMVNLKLIPYLASKFVVFGSFALVQVFLLLVILLVGVEFPSIGALLEMYISLYLATMASIALGLFISAISRTSTQAVYTILIILFVQIIFSGVIFEVRGKAIEPLSYLTTTRWSLVALGTSADIPELAQSSIGCGSGLELDESTVQFDPATGQINADAVELVETDETVCRHSPVDVDDLSLPYGDNFLALIPVWMILWGFGFVLTVGTFIAVKSLDGREVRLA